MVGNTIETKYDDELRMIGHFKIYEEMLPWIGPKYGRGQKRLLFVGESHYLGRDAKDIQQEPITYHLNSEQWYRGVTQYHENNEWFMTRGIIQNGIDNKWNLKSRVIYRNIEKVLYDSGFCFRAESAFHRIAFMNYFQRPAEVVGKSIKVSSFDRDVAYSVWAKVVDIIKPNVVVFTSSLAWRNATKLGCRKLLQEAEIVSMRTPHPGCAWWNRKSKIYGNISGREALLAFIKKHQ